ncbi:recombinase family protein [Pacificispira sp.]|uniref:recombinase family protein n=1 Tax=Pacificispira sp. TaxID=2888761 RepID=UPI003B51D17E
MVGPKPPLRRCAVYTRKSTEEGLEQDFNSLDAQREACEAFIRSQSGEGWKLIPTPYDDGGFSGGSMERPALARLLSDIEERRIDTVVVYKVDRLTRSLSDFARIVDVFDGHGVSFVSVTQQFNTTTSMGRLTLNMLLSFAQFEREVTGERIRDKIAASKRKGMWMGGRVPLGYEPNGRTLAIDESGAETVQTIFRLYLELGNVRLVKAEADRRGLTTKRRTSANEKQSGGRPMSRGYIYKLLGNPLYAGRISHKGQTYEGQHPPIIDDKTWDAVQTMLAGNTRAKSSRSRSTDRSPLMGKLFDETGAPLTPSHAVKSGRRYRYYVSKRLIDNTVSGGESGWRLPAREVERFVKDSIRGLLADRAALTQAARNSGMTAHRIAGLLDTSISWKGNPLDIVERIDLASERVLFSLNLAPLTDQSDLIIDHVVCVNFRRRGVETKLVLEGSGGVASNPDPALIEAIVRAHQWFNELVSGSARSLREISEKEGISDRYISHLMPLAFLAPELVESILAGEQPIGLTTEKLTNRVTMPLCWNEQHRVLGFSHRPSKY